ncbi:MAG: hypothetical protein HYU39_04905 [Thaumarchaeota archaeon]|nr:hypothetical protein [Nitrososphaerota archaeon]
MRTLESIGVIFVTVLAFSLLILTSYAEIEDTQRQTESIQGVVQNITSKGLYLNTGSETLLISSGGRWSYAIRGETKTYSWGEIVSGSYIRIGDMVMVSALKDSKGGATPKATRIEDLTSGALLAEAKGGGEEKAPNATNDIEKFLKSQDTKLNVTLAIVGGTSFVVGFGARDILGRRKQRQTQETMRHPKQ